MDEDPETTALQVRLIAEGRLHPAVEPDGLFLIKSHDRGIKPAQIDDAIGETREDRR
jgi:hypothetical protein